MLIVSRVKWHSYRGNPLKVISICLQSCNKFTQTKIFFGKLGCPELYGGYKNAIKWNLTNVLLCLVFTDPVTCTLICSSKQMFIMI